MFDGGWWTRHERSRLNRTGKYLCMSGTGHNKRRRWHDLALTAEGIAAQTGASLVAGSPGGEQRVQARGSFAGDVMGKSSRYRRGTSGTQAPWIACGYLRVPRVPSPATASCPSGRRRVGSCCAWHRLLLKSPLRPRVPARRAAKGAIPAGFLVLQEFAEDKSA